MPEPSISESAYAAFLDDLLRGRRGACAAAVERFIDGGVDLRELYAHLFQRALYEVGALWEANRVSVAVEHLATATVESLFALVYPVLFARERIGCTGVVACVANEHHQVGAKIIADMLELNGWDSVFLGANTPLPDLLSLLDDREPSFVGLSLAIYFNLEPLLLAIDKIRCRCPDLPIVVGGQAFRWGGQAAVQRLPGVQLIEDLWSFEAALGALR